MATRIWRRFTGPWRGDYPDWAAARSHSTGYEATAIVERTTSSIRQVLAGQKAFERDSVAFDEIQYPWPILAILLKVAHAKRAPMRVIDYGGSLGSTYLRVRRFVEDAELDWSIVELPAVAARGRELFGLESPRFFTSLESALAGGPVDLLLLSSVLPYLPNPEEFAAYAASLQIPWILIDRTYLTVADRPSRLTVQHVPPHIYEASYPAWILNRQALLRWFQPSYEVFAEFDAPDRLNLPAESKGLALRHR